ncbi:TPA: hypothetical protein DDW35_11595 [Candidatus Sumerlaeota bacterium]|nr:hypothetical protein [Candidatus Sumerlaeota bacterium]
MLANADKFVADYTYMACAEAWFQMASEKSGYKTEPLRSHFSQLIRNEGDAAIAVARSLGSSKNVERFLENPNLSALPAFINCAGELAERAKQSEEFASAFLQCLLRVAEHYPEQAKSWVNTCVDIALLNIVKHHSLLANYLGALNPAVGELERVLFKINEAINAISNGDQVAAIRLAQGCYVSKFHGRPCREHRKVPPKHNTYKLRLYGQGADSGIPSIDGEIADISDGIFAEDGAGLAGRGIRFRSAAWTFIDTTYPPEDIDAYGIRIKARAISAIPNGGSGHSIADSYTIPNDRTLLAQIIYPNGQTFVCWSWPVRATPYPPEFNVLDGAAVIFLGEPLDAAEYLQNFITWQRDIRNFPQCPYGKDGQIA